MSLMIVGLLSAAGLLLGILLVYEIGWRLGRRGGPASKNDSAGSGLLDGAVYALLGLLIAFTFSGAAERFDRRRALVIEESNAIGTAYLRLDLLPVEAQPRLRALFRQYLDARLNMTRKLPDKEASRVAVAQANNLQGQIWPVAVKACQDSGSVPATTLLLAALNQMFDIATLRTTVSWEMHPPMVIFEMLFVLALISAGLGGYAAAGAKQRNWVHVLAFAAITTGTVYVILDIEYPRLGLIRVDSVDRVLIDLRKSMD
ncbi:MAG: bestrophin-like domain [Methylobacter sp.]